MFEPGARVGRRRGSGRRALALGARPGAFAPRRRPALGAVDPEGLPFADHVSAAVEQATAPHAGGERGHVFAALGHPRAPPRVAARGGEDQLVAVPQTHLEEARDGGADHFLPGGGEAHVVHEQDEGPRPGPRRASGWWPPGSPAPLATAASGASPRSKASKLARACGLPSSRRVKSSSSGPAPDGPCRRPRPRPRSRAPPWTRRSGCRAAPARRRTPCRGGRRGSRRGGLLGSWLRFQSVEVRLRADEDRLARDGGGGHDALLAERRRGRARGTRGRVRPRPPSRLRRRSRAPRPRRGARPNGRRRRPGAARPRRRSSRRGRSRRRPCRRPRRRGRRRAPARAWRRCRA